MDNDLNSNTGEDGGVRDECSSCDLQFDIDGEKNQTSYSV